MPLEHVMIMSNFDPAADEIMFTSEKGSWNVTRAQRDCDAGLHGNPFLLDVAECYEANKGVEVDMEKVFRFMKDPEILLKPCIAAMEDGACWFIEGHHRLRALYLARIPRFPCFVIEDIRRYVIWFNGKRTLTECQNGT